MSDRVVVGRVGRPHGLDGSFVVEEASDAPERFAQGAELIAAGEPAKVVASKRAGKGRLIVKLDRRVERGTALEVAREALPAPEAGEWYVFQLVGLDIEEEGGRPLGKVADVEPWPANDVLVLENGAMLPLVDACVLEVDLDAGRILVAPGFADAG
ncbi:MAG: ribosome maturation factor RimM [Actinomycetota bacterium]|nr:ribosome maturation factor RimM [Actinomycetota bacterium]